MIEPGMLAEFADARIAGNLRLDEHLLQAMNDKNLESVMACFLDNPDLVVVLYGNVLRGPEALRQFLAAMFAGMRTVQLDINEISRWCVGETVFAVGIATYNFEALDGTKSTIRECWTDARREVAGRWVYILDHATEVPLPRAT